MSQATELSDRIKALAKPFQAVIDISAYLDELGSLDSAKSEAIAARDRAITGRDAATAALAVALQEVTDAERGVVSAANESSATIDAAHEQSRLLLEDAKEQAARLIAVAQSDADAITAQAVAKQAVLDSLTQTIGIARGDLATLEAKKAAVKAELSTFLS